MNEPKLMPIQHSHILSREQLKVCEQVYMRAYEVYSHIYGPQQAMIEGGCRGGFGIGELAGFLYAGNFPKAEWKDRWQEAQRGMKL